MMKSRIVVYTALFGNYDQLKDPVEQYDSIDFICFTDNEKLQSAKWSFRLVQDSSKSSVLLNREYKFFPHNYLQEYEYSIYIDANIQIIGNPRSLIDRYLQNVSIAIPKHFLRDCIYEEIEANVVSEKISPTAGEEILNRYNNEGFPRKYGLGENNIIIRRHCSVMMKELMQKWWEMFNEYAKRDQLYLMYLFWRTGTPFVLMDESGRNRNSFFRYHLHSKEKALPVLKRIHRIIESRDTRFYRVLNKLLF